MSLWNKIKSSLLVFNNSTISLIRIIIFIRWIGVNDSSVAHQEPIK